MVIEKSNRVSTQWESKVSCKRALSCGHRFFAGSPSQPEPAVLKTQP